MLNWWLGNGGSRIASEDQNVEPPETPAPVFAARALRSAFFGTPAPPDDTPFIRASEKIPETSAINNIQQSRNLSPMKPTGILMTPGTATSRRKSVTFGHDVKNEDILAAREGRRTGRNRPTRSASLTKALEIAKEEKLKKSSSGAQEHVIEVEQSLDKDDQRASEQMPHPVSRKLNKDYLTKPDLIKELSRDDPEGDVTMDLNKPHSESGRYWKAEFYKYHEEAQIQMKKLLEYKEGAKDFARKKDAEVLELSQKLGEEKSKNELLEKKNALPSKYEYDANIDVPKLVKELAKQVALSAQYKKQIDELKHGPDSVPGRTTANLLSHDILTMTAGTDGSPHVKLLREEIVHLQKATKRVEKEKSKLHDENRRLIDDLSQSAAKIEKLTEKLEKQRTSTDEMRRKKDEALDQLQRTYDDLKERAKSQRRDAEQQLKRKHDQAVELRRELADAQGSQTTVQNLREELERSKAEHSRIVADYEIQIAGLKTDVLLGAETGIDLRSSIQYDPELPELPTKSHIGISNLGRQRESQIPLASQSISRPSKASTRQTWSETPQNSPPKKSHLPLSELINNADPTTIPPVQRGPVEFTPAVHRFSNLAMPNPDLDLPSEEPTMDIAPIIPDRKHRISPRPAIINIPSSPPNPIRIASKELDAEKAEIRGRYTSLASSRLNMDSSRIRREIAPERAAAAKARLEQKLAEKRRVQSDGHGKENVHI